MPKQKLEARQREMKARLEPKTQILFEEPLTIQEAAPLWGQSEEATRAYFRNVPGVRVIPSPTRYVGGRRKRAYNTILIPPSVLEAEIRRTTVP